MAEIPPGSPLQNITSELNVYREKALGISQDRLAEEEAGDFEKKKEQSHLDLLALQNEALAGFITLRKDYAKKIFEFLVYWSSAVLLITTISASSYWVFELPESVLITLVGSTTANVIALVGLVVKGLFQKDIQNISPS